MPLMKEPIRTLLSRSSEAADLSFEHYENNSIRELLMNAYWEKTPEVNKYEKLDVVDKKTVGLDGRGHTKLNIVDGMVRLTVHDPFDVLVDTGQQTFYDYVAAQFNRLVEVGLTPPL